jgi:hypothetical protein
MLTAIACVAAMSSVAAQQPPTPDVKPAVAVSAPPRVAPNSKIYIEPAENGIHTALAGALQKKKVPVTVVTRVDAADYIIRVTGEYKKAGWARTIMAGGYARGDANASMTVEHRETATVTYAYNVDKGGAWKGIQSAAEACAKHLKNHIDGKE